MNGSDLINLGAEPCSQKTNREQLIKAKLQGIAILDGGGQKNSLFFAKDLKNLKKFLTIEKKDLFQDSFLLFSEKLEDKIQPEELIKLDNLFLGLYKAKDVNNIIAEMSRYFYDQKIKDLNNFVDGRQMGTARVHPTALIAQGAFIGEAVEIAENVVIHANAVIQGPGKIGANSIIFSNTVIYPFVEIGCHVRVHANCTLGADGFGYFFDGKEHKKFWHYGGVKIEDKVEIGANTSIDSGTFSPTLIQAGAKIDNHVQIGHNTQLGKMVILCGQVGIAGSTKIGDYCVVGGKAGFGQDLEVAAGCEIAGNAMVNTSWKEKVKLAGHPARPLRDWLRSLATLKRLTEEKSKG